MRLIKSGPGLLKVQTFLQYPLCNFGLVSRFAKFGLVNLVWFGCVLVGLVRQVWFGRYGLDGLVP